MFVTIVKKMFKRKRIHVTIQVLKVSRMANRRWNYMYWYLDQVIFRYTSHKHLIKQTNKPTMFKLIMRFLRRFSNCSAKYFAYRTIAGQITCKSSTTTKSLKLKEVNGKISRFNIKYLSYSVARLIVILNVAAFGWPSRI